jgi:hypothetical protein
MPNSEGLIAPDDQTDEFELGDCEDKPCTKTARCTYNGKQYCTDCLVAQFSPELYAIEQQFLGGKRVLPCCTYSVVCDDDDEEDEAKWIEITFPELATFNGIKPTAPMRVSMKALEKAKKETENEHE